MKNGKVHSEEWINDARQYWWNEDYIELILKRNNLLDVKSMADIGCGKGYMTFKFLPHLPNIKECFGRDIEQTHIDGAKAIADTCDTDATFNFKTASAYDIDIDTNKVDLAVCQTLLLHLDNPLQAINEMKRITKPGGTIMAIETNNSINSLVTNSFVGENNIEQIEDTDKTLRYLKYDLLIQKGIHTLGEGFISLGDYVPKLFLDAGLKDIDVSIVDKACSLIPPYDTKEKKARAKELLDWMDDESADYDKEQMLKYYLAGGGNENEFNNIWEEKQKDTLKIKQAILDEKYIMPGGALMYIITGKK